MLKMQVMFRQGNYGCMFPGSPCCTQTKTDGNAPCSLITFIFQCASLTRSRRYVQNLQHRIIRMIIIVKWKEFSLREHGNIQVLCTTYEYLEFECLVSVQANQSSIVNRVPLPFLVSLHHH